MGTMSQMRAAMYSAVGPAADVLRVDRIAIPKPGPNQVRVRMAFSGVNPTDVKTRSGRTPRDMAEFQIPHQDGAGVIDIVGANVDPARIGERVWVMLAAFDSIYGTAAEYCIVDVGLVRTLPESVSLELGATLGVPAVTAAHCVLGDGPVDNAVVLVHGGTGGVGRCAVQIAKWAGATVVATASSDEKRAAAIAAGADFAFDYRDADSAFEIREAVGAVDRVIEVNLTANLEMDLEVSKPGTVVVTYAADGDDPVIPRRRLMGANLTLQFMLLYTLPPAALAAAVSAVESALVDGALTMPPVRYFELEEIVAAHEAQEGGSVERVLVRC
jgi:NADPH2:quinone reductase